MISAEFYAFEAMTIMAGTIGVNALACQTVSYVVYVMTYNFAIGI